MTAEGWVIIIGSISGAITSIMTTLVLLLRRDVQEARAEVQHARSEVKQVHTLVNQQHTDEVAYRKVLTDALKLAGVKVPVDKAVEERGTR